MTLPPDLRSDLLQSIPSMRVFVISLTGNIDQADDLVQEAMVRGLAHINQFQPGTNIQAWLFTILRNQFHTAFRKRRRKWKTRMAASQPALPSFPSRTHISM